MLLEFTTLDGLRCASLQLSPEEQLYVEMHKAGIEVKRGHTFGKGDMSTYTVVHVRGIDREFIKKALPSDLALTRVGQPHKMRRVPSLTMLLTEASENPCEFWWEWSEADHKDRGVRVQSLLKNYLSYSSGFNRSYRISMELPRGFILESQLRGDKLVSPDTFQGWTPL